MKNGVIVRILKKFAIYIFLIAAALAVIVPIAWVFTASIKENSEFYGNPWALPAGIHIENFAKAWNAGNMAVYMLNSAVVTITALIILTIVSLPAAYVLARFKFKTRTVFHVLFMAGLFINVNYIVVPIFLMLNNADNFIKELFGRTFFINNIFILALVYAATALPFAVYLLTGYFKSINEDYEAAAYADGAGYFTTMVKIMFPMARPGIAAMLLFNFLIFWNEYIISMTLLTDERLKTISVGLTHIMATQKTAVEYGQLYAGLVLVMFPVIMVYIFMRKRLTAVRLFASSLK